MQDTEVRRDRLDGVRWVELGVEDTAPGMSVCVCGKCGLEITPSDALVSVFDVPRMRQARLHGECFQEAVQVGVVGGVGTVGQGQREGAA